MEKGIKEGGKREAKGRRGEVPPRLEPAAAGVEPRLELSPGFGGGRVENPPTPAAHHAGELRCAPEGEKNEEYREEMGEDQRNRSCGTGRPAISCKSCMARSARLRRKKSARADQARACECLCVRLGRRELRQKAPALEDSGGPLPDRGDFDGRAVGFPPPLRGGRAARGRFSHTGNGRWRRSVGMR